MLKVKLKEAKDKAAPIQESATTIKIKKTTSKMKS